MPEELVETKVEEMPPRKSESAHRKMLLVLVCGLVALGVILWKVDHELTDLTHTLALISEDVRSSQPKPVVDKPREVTVEQKTLRTKLGLLVFTHECVGKVDLAEKQTLPHCVGENGLKVTVDGDKSIELDRRTVTSAADAPVLSKLEYIASGNVLVSYEADKCVTMNDCAAGQARHHVSMAFDAAAKTSRVLNRFPQRGWPTWNPEGVKAVFIPETCGGAGCQLATLTGYNLADDSVTIIDKQAAVGTDNVANAKDEDGKRLPVWTKVEWKDNKTVVATYLDEKGKEQTIEATY